MTTITTTQITDNFFNDTNPQVSGFGEVVWEHEYSLFDRDIYYYENGITSYIASSFDDETNPQISYWGDVAYESYNSTTFDSNIEYYDWFSGTTETVADSFNYEYNPQIDGNYIVYEEEYSVSDHDIYAYDTYTDTEIPIATSIDYEWGPDVDGNYVTYHSEYAIGDNDIYLYDLYNGTTTTVAASGNDETNAQVSSYYVYDEYYGYSEQAAVVYEYEYAVGDSDIYLYLDETGETRYLATSIYDEINPDIAGDYVTWQAWDGNDYEVYRHDILTNTTEQLTDNFVDDTNPQVSELGYVVWEHQYSLFDTDIYLHDGNDIQYLATSFEDEINPDITGNYVTWQAWDGNDYEVYSATVTESFV